MDKIPIEECMYEEKINDYNGIESMSSFKHANLVTVNVLSKVENFCGGAFQVQSQFSN